ncbi:MAG TPA: phage tail protein [Ilumatobacter sp.]|nr:phage tail protein [Ilumatobacter sp.]
MTTVVPSGKDERALISSKFTVTFKQVASGIFTEVSGLSIDIEEVQSTYVTPDGKTVTRWGPGTVKYSTLTLKREFNPSNKEFWDWHDKMCKGAAEWSDGGITLHTLDGSAADAWNVYNAWPSKWSVGDLDAGTDDVLIEEIELQIEFLERA